MTTPSTTKIQQILRDVWGYDSFRPLQENSIACVLGRRDSLTVLPTGGGKSLCFQAPALCFDGMAVVVSPLISLMKDQVDALRTCGVNAAFINSTQSSEEKRQVTNQIRSGSLKLLYLAPERLLDGYTLQFLKESSVSFFAIDEAHCISAWGHDFRPEYRDLRALKEQFPDVAVHGFTATASAPVRTDIVKQLGIGDAEVLVGDFDRPNLTYRMLRSNNRLRQVMEVTNRHPGESGIIYCISRRDVDRTAGALAEMGCSALPYHAGMNDASRRANQDAFIKEKCNVMVATVAFGMGIDKSNVRYVIHAGMPKSIEHYQQESGRAGRDGLESECVLIYSGGDVVTWKKIMSGDNAQASKTAFQSLDAMRDLCASTVCRHRQIVAYFGQSYPSDNCGACDVCLDELDLVEDPITISQKILSCVLRVEERFGGAHTAKVLTGSSEKRLRDFGHDKLSTYGLLADDGMKTVRMWIEQLVQQRFLLRTGEYQTLSLSDSGRRLLRRDGAPQLTIPAKSSGSQGGSAPAESWEGVDRGLFDVLRQLRSDLATQQNVPAYVIFSDASLRDMARCRPDSVQLFGDIRGVGEQKRIDFGQAFVTAIGQHCTEHSLTLNVTAVQTAVVDQPDMPSPSAFAAFDAFRRGDPIEDIARRMGRATSTTYGYLQAYLKHERITDASPWVDQATRERILDHIHLLVDGRLKPLFEFFESQVPYESIRTVVTCHKNAQMAQEIASD